MPLFIPSRKILFVHVYKTGGMSVRHALHQVFGYQIIELGLTHNPILPHFPKPHFSFAITRNPYEWSVSQYKFIKYSNENHPSKEIVKNMSYQDFVPYLIESTKLHRQWLAGNFMTQSEMVKGVDYVMSLENMNEDWKKVCDVIGMNIPLRKINESDYYSPPIDTTLDDETLARFNETFGKDFLLKNYPVINSMEYRPF